MDAFIGKGPVGAGHFQRNDAPRQAAEGHGQVVVVGTAFFHEGCNAHLLGVADDLGRANFIGQLDGDGIDRMGQSLPQGHGPGIGFFCVLGAPSAVGDFLVFHSRVRRHVVLQGRHVDEGFECRPGLADGHAGPVEAVLSASADHGQDVTVAGIDGNEGALWLGQAVLVGVIVGQVLHGLYGCMLFFRIESRINLEPFFIQGIVAVFGGYLLGYIVDERFRFRVFRYLLVVGQVEIGVFGFRCLIG